MLRFRHARPFDEVKGRSCSYHQKRQTTWPTTVPTAGAVRRRLDDGAVAGGAKLQWCSGLAAADHLWIGRNRGIPAHQRPREHACRGPGARPELRIPGAAAQTRIVSVVEFGWIPGNPCDLSKGYFATTFLSSSPPTQPASPSLRQPADLRQRVASGAIWDRRARQCERFPAAAHAKAQAASTQVPP
jgi:hypothetical protein